MASQTRNVFGTFEKRAPGVGVGRGANVKQTMLCYNVYYMFFHSSSLQDRRYFCAFFRRARR